MKNHLQYLQKASLCFNKVADILKEDSLRGKPELEFWQVGRVFNSCHDYILQNGASIPADVARYENEVRPGCMRVYTDQAGKPDNQNWWWDDYGWWGLAHLAAGDAQKAKDCWFRMRTYGVDSGQLGPEYEGGCWNHTINQNPAGCENSVTNSTFFLLSLRLLNDASINIDPLRTQILAAAEASAQWFDRWMGRLGTLLNPLQLLRERPVGDAKGLFPKGAPTYEPGWIWTGDQGLAVAWAAEAFKLTQIDWRAVFPGVPYRAKAFEMAGQIRRGMTLLFDADRVLHEAPYRSNSLGDYNIDYSTGRGVFMRYISHADQVFRLEPGWGSSGAEVQSTADAVIAQLAEPSPTMYSWSYSREPDVLATWKAKVNGDSEGDPCLCSGAVRSTDPKAELSFYGIALDALTAATAVAQ